MDNALMFSSKTDEWYTPIDFFEQLNNEFHFNLDPCATDKNHKCMKYFTKRDNGLLQNWGGYRVFCNPPYGRVIGEWVKKAYEEAQKPETLIVMLLPARTDTRWFHEFIYKKAEIRFIRGRLKFGGCKNAAPFPSMIVIFKNENTNSKTIEGQTTIFDFMEA